MLIAQGAEAKIYLDKRKIFKKRICKKYRKKELDTFLRKTRTKKEAKLLADVKRIGVKVPAIFNIKKFSIEMEFIEGKKLKNYLNKNNYKKFCTKIGEDVAKMHRADIIHGDLTTSNLIVRNGELYLIDFGLGIETKNLEQKAADLLTLYQNFKSVHPEFECWEYFLKGYKKKKTAKVSVASQQCSVETSVLEVFEKMLKRRRYI